MRVATVFVTMSCTHVVEVSVHTSTSDHERRYCMHHLHHPWLYLSRTWQAMRSRLLIGPWKYARNLRRCRVWRRWRMGKLSSGS